MALTVELSEIIIMTSESANSKADLRVAIVMKDSFGRSGEVFSADIAIGDAINLCCGVAHGEISLSKIFSKGSA